MKRSGLWAHDAQPCRIPPLLRPFVLDVIVIKKSQEDVDVEQGAHR